MNQSTSTAARPGASAPSASGSAPSSNASGEKHTEAARTSASAGAPGAKAEAEGGHLGGYLEDARALGRRAEISLFKHPYSTLGAVAAAGFFAGSVFGSRLGQLALAAGVGYSLARVFPEASAIGRKLTDG